MISSTKRVLFVLQKYTCKPKPKGSSFRPKANSQKTLISKLYLLSFMQSLLPNILMYDQDINFYIILFIINYFNALLWQALQIKKQNNIGNFKEPTHWQTGN